MEQGVPPEIVRKQPASSIGMLWQRDILEGYTILIPRTLHMSLTVLAFLFYVLGIIPSWFLMKNPTAFLAAALSPIGLTGAVMASQAIARRHTRANVLHLPGYFVDKVGSDVLAIAVSVAGILMSIAFVAVLTPAVAACPTKTVQNLCTMTCGDLQITNTTDWKAVMTVPGFTMNIVWYGICIDGYPFAIFSLVVAYLQIVLFIVIIWYEARLRANSLAKLLLVPAADRTSLAELVTVTQRPVVPTFIVNEGQPFLLRYRR